ncbi:MAG: RDD family protein [Actinomycetota bacterium]|nr:RDD family protein [Actinomycetota bacterium]MDQ3574566.1 RDD family protein [Actinomycetota bacterium]
MAEWWKRLVAIIIDGLILGVPLFILYIILIAGSISQTTIDPITGEIEGGGGILGGAFLLFFLVAIAANLAYYGILNGGAAGQTVGKKVMKIQVRDANSGGPIGVGRGVGRAAIPSVAGALCFLVSLLDGLWPLWDDKRQALHDKVANSVVVDAA